MTLLLIIISLITFSLTANFFPKYNKLFICVSILLVISFYFYLSKNFFYIENFFPSTKPCYYHPCGNYYNFLVNSLKKHKLYIAEDDEHLLSTDPTLYKTYDISYTNYKNIPSLFDTSYYNEKIYLYFGITPVLLFYLPFNLVTNLYLTDKLLIFILSCFIFLLSLFLVNKLSKGFVTSHNIPPNIIILSIFFIGICNKVPFILVRSTIYESAITTAVFLLLLSLCLFYFYIVTEHKKKKNILIFLIALSLCLSVGARPYYVLFIPIFFLSVLWIEYKETKCIYDMIKATIIFLIPCFIYGTIVALYNYLRFDSIFEFGWTYQLNPLNQYEYVANLKDLITGLTNNIFHLPDMNERTIFSLSKTSGHSLGEDDIVGIIWTYPIVFILIFIPIFLKNFYKKSTNYFLFTLILISIIIISIIITSFIGMINRYSLEYLSIIIILSTLIFFFCLNKIDDKTTRNFLNILFILLFVYSIFINISLLFCKGNAAFYASSSGNNYIKIIKLLF